MATAPRGRHDPARAVLSFRTAAFPTARMLTVVMYHYVRDLPRSRYPRIKGLQTSGFDAQLDHLCSKFRPCLPEELVAAARSGRPPPSDSFLLTFDDGLIDHYTVVLPRLVERGLTGVFFVPARPVEERVALAVHKLHFVLAAVEDHDALVAELFDLLLPFRHRYRLPSDEELYTMLDLSTRFDAPETVFLKRALQRDLPRRIREAIVAELFTRHVTRDERAFADELYLDHPQLGEMRAAGMVIGGHGDRHEWLGSLPDAEQAREIERTVAFLAKVEGAQPSDWMMGYPYGSYNRSTLRLLRRAGCALGFTTRVARVTDWSTPLELARLDTNDLPQAVAT
jgi:peptidoglycan/xylan/chitin deacetylase (PgdA/CDA1 family)